MRLLFLLFIYLLPFSTTYGQHIKFMGMEVTGNYENYKDSLISKGFVYLDSFETMHRFYGRFANELVTLNIMASPKTNTVFKTIVYFPEKDKWCDLKKDYFTKKEMYKDNYPINRYFEFFSFPYEIGDGYEMRAVSKEKCRYISFFLAVGGYISVEIDKSCRIKVVYEDRENIEQAKFEFEQKAIDDI